MNTLVMRQCNVVLAAGPAEVAAASAQAQSLPRVRFVVIGGKHGPGNLTVVGLGNPHVVSGAVDGAVRAAVAAAG
jgi:hypothetical protein